MVTTIKELKESYEMQYDCLLGSILDGDERERIVRSERRSTLLDIIRDLERLL